MVRIQYELCRVGSLFDRRSIFEYRLVCMIIFEITDRD